MLATADAAPMSQLPPDSRPRATTGGEEEAGGRAERRPGVGRVRWFAPHGCVIERGDEFEVVVSGLIIGAFDRGDHARRNVLLVTLGQSGRIHLGHLAEAFEVSADTSRELRRSAERAGLESVARTLRRGRRPKLSAAQERKAMGLFEQGLNAAEVMRRLGRGARIRTVQRLRSRWREERREARSVPKERVSLVTIPVEEPAVTASAPPALEGVTCEPVAAATAEAIVAAPAEGAPPTAPAPVAAEVMEERPDDERANETLPVRSARGVQHLGTWLMTAVLSQWKLYERVGALSKESSRAEADSTRIALEAVVAALSIGEGTVEGVRRVATPSAGALLRARWAPSASWALKYSYFKEPMNGKPHSMVGRCNKPLALYCANSEAWKSEPVYWVP